MNSQEVKQHLLLCKRNKSFFQLHLDKNIEVLPLAIKYNRKVLSKSAPFY